MNVPRSSLEGLARSLDSLTRTYLALISLIASALVCVVDLFTLRSYYLFVLFFTVFLACLLYVALRRKNASTTVASLTQLGAQAERRAHKILNIFFVCLASVCVLLLSAALYARPLSFLVLISVLAGLIAVEIAITSDARHVSSVLLKTIILGILVRASAYFEYPSQLGGDPWYHEGFIQYILEHGYIPAHAPQYAGLEYPSMPMMHLVVTALSQSTGIGVHSSYFFIGVVECISIVFIFLIGRAAVNTHTGLLAALLLVLANQLLFWGIHITPLTIGVVFTFVLLCVFFLVPRQDMISYTVILLVLFASVILTHEGTGAYTAIVLVVVLISSAFLSKILRAATSRTSIEDIKALSLHLRSAALLIALFIGALIGYWISLGGSAMQRVLAIWHGGVASTSALAPSAAGDSSAGAQLGAVPSASVQFVPPSSVPLWTDLPVLILIFFATFGLLYALSRERKKALTISWLGASALILMITAAIYFFGGTTSQPERWIVYLEAFMVIPAAVGILALSSLPSARKGLAVIFSAVLILGFVGVTHTNAKVVSELPWDQRPRIALMESEVTAAQTITNKTNGMRVQTDLQYAPIFGWQLNFTNISARESFYNASDITKSNNSLLLRVEIANNPWNTVVGTLPELGVERYKSFEAAKNVIYDSGTVQLVTTQT